MIQIVDRLEAQDERRVAVLFHHDRGEERRLEAVRRSFADDTAEAAKGGASVRFLVIRKMIEVALHEMRRPQSRNQPSLTSAERNRSRIHTPFRSLTTPSGVHSLPV